MQQKSTQKILLFSVAAQKVEKIKALCKTLGISVQQVEKSDYGQKLGAIAGITGFKKDGSRYSGADFGPTIFPACSCTGKPRLLCSCRIDNIA